MEIGFFPRMAPPPSANAVQARDMLELLQELVNRSNEFEQAGSRRFSLSSLTCAANSIMTLDDFKTENMMHDSLSKLLVSVLKQAQAEQKLVSGMYEAAKTLGRNPQDVAFCVLPQNHLNDVERHINHMLMEAFCHENYIRILKVDCEEKLAELLFGKSTTEAGSVSGQYQKDFSCILVKAWSTEKNYEGDKLMCLLEMEGIGSQSIIELPLS